MKIKISLPEVRGSIKGIHKEPARIFKKVTMTVQINVGNYLTNLMKADMTREYPPEIVPTVVRV